MRRSTINASASLSKLKKQPFKSKIYALIDLGLSVGAIFVIAFVLCMFTVGAGLAIDSTLHRLTLTRSVRETVTAAFGAGNSKILTYAGLAMSCLIYVEVAFAVAIVARFRGGSDWRDLVAWRPWSLWRSERGFWLIVGGTLAYGFAADFALTYFYPQSDAWLSMPKDLTAAIALSVLAVVFAPVVEELIFRGWIFTQLRRHFSFATALLASSIVFAGLHYESTHLYALVVFPVGLALGAIRELTGSIKPTIVFHAFNNFLACSLSFFDSG